MQRSFMIIVLLFLSLASVRAIQQNYTVDDTSPDIIYTDPQAIFQCSNATTACPDGLKDGLFNESVTFTTGNISFSFTGTAFYVSLDLIGACSITLDGTEITTLNVTLGDVLAAAASGEQPGFSVSKSDMADGPHTLLVAPFPTTDATATIIGFDQVIYTATLPDKKSHVGAIVGGVIGGVVLTIGVLFAAMFARRRKLILRRNQRKSAVLRVLSTASARPDYKTGANADARADYKAGADDGTV
ncbi:hypothetical protein DFH07DRAFT_72761 [Mycena maculata]|uniref:Mid2 domain-containing protein n=1 Tax=Mycena maculata TaxID=230809 RepID=A0AAD7K2N3_9AGAR|nr:hypothetical protein DFH07DRAFT_374232 [Mycena maculata]KAJ7775902.1 hypothetical protein DFH07DRAFT_72761 [Mycena maculata]